MRGAYLCFLSALLGGCAAKAQVDLMPAAPGMQLNGAVPVWRLNDVAGSWEHWTEWRESRKPEENGDTAGKYKWSGLIWQSIEFNVVENGFRVASDPLMRDTLAHRPFWHDYDASMGQFNMRRWNDGDTFIVNYVGHSMHGAVASYIEIQNSPTDARLQWGDPGYSWSRFKGFLWATVYSTHSEISPAGEAGVGNEGGFTYGVKCEEKCTSANFKPGDKYTNNTGWVDFIVSPTAGTLWVLAEDFLDKYVSDRFREKYPEQFWPKVVRGGLNPSRSFANMLRWRVPWYRDFEEPHAQPTRVRWFPSDEQAEWQKLPQVQIAPYFNNYSIAGNTPDCFNCRVTTGGGGVQVIYKLHDWLSLDSAVSYHPNASPLPSDRAGGDMTSAVIGAGATKQWRYYSVHVAIRPGVVRFSNAYLTSPKIVIVEGYPPGIATTGGDAPAPVGPGVVDANGTTEEPALGAIHHFVWDVNLSVDYRLNRHLGFRFGVNEEMVRYRTDKEDAPGIGTPPYLSWLSKQQFLNRSNYSVQMGPVFSF